MREQKRIESDVHSPKGAGSPLVTEIANLIQQRMGGANLGEVADMLTEVHEMCRKHMPEAPKEDEDKGTPEAGL